jgi:cell division ATPase FtsA
MAMLIPLRPSREGQHMLSIPIVTAEVIKINHHNQKRTKQETITMTSVQQLKIHKIKAKHVMVLNLERIIKCRRRTQTSTLCTMITRKRESSYHLFT